MEFPTSFAGRLSVRHITGAKGSVMLDLRLIREDAEKVEKALARRNGGLSTRSLVEVDGQFRKKLAEWEGLRARSNQISGEFKTGKVAKEDMDKLKAESKELKANLESLDKEKQELETRLDELLMAIPNYAGSECTGWSRRNRQC